MCDAKGAVKVTADHSVNGIVDEFAVNPSGSLTPAQQRGLDLPGSQTSARRLLRAMLAQPQHVRRRGDVVVSGRREVREFGHHRVG